LAQHYKDVRLLKPILIPGRVAPDNIFLAQSSTTPKASRFCRDELFSDAAWRYTCLSCKTLDWMMARRIVYPVAQYRTDMFDGSQPYSTLMGVDI
jgi:hypothetical protein